MSRCGSTSTATVYLAVSPDLGTRIRDAVRVMRRSVIDATAADRQLLDDITRRRPRYGFGAFERLAMIAARCTNPADGLALPEAVRGFILAHRPAADRVGFFPAIMQETQANHEANQEEHRTQYQFCRSRLLTLIEKMMVQREMSQRVIDEAHIELAALDASSFTVVR